MKSKSKTKQAPALAPAPQAEGACPRKGETKDFDVPGLAGASVTVVFAGPKAGRHWSKGFLALCEADRGRVAAEQAKTTKELSPGLWAPGYCTDAFKEALVSYVRLAFESLATRVNGVRGFGDGPADVGEFVEHLSYGQAQSVLAMALAYQVPTLKLYVQAQEA